MKLQKYDINQKKKMMMIGVGITSVLLVGVFFYRSLVIYDKSNGINEQMLNSNNNMELSLLIEDEGGNQTYTETMPEGTNWSISISCDNGATGTWDYTNWGPKITSLTRSKTKCKVIFGQPKSIIDVIKSITPVTTGNGLYQVTHSDANITYTTNATAINNLKMTELRYAGSNPNNYVTFNNELWRIIGLVNTPEGQRVKMIRNESIGGYSWDSSSSSVNSGVGVNEWSQADIMKLLNQGAYYNRTSGNCYSGGNNETSSCDFSSTGLTAEAKNMIDTVTWNTGSQGSDDYTTEGTPNNFYQYERSNNTGKICSSGSYCDSVTRKTTWKGQIGLIYPSDYGYATGAGWGTRCSEISLSTWNSSDTSARACKDNDWLVKGFLWTLTPSANSAGAQIVFTLANAVIGIDMANNPNDIYPALYLKTDVKVRNGNGEVNNSYVLLKN